MMIIEKITPEHRQFMDSKLGIKQHIKFRAFLINLILIALCCWLSSCDALMNWIARVMGTPSEIISMSMLCMLIIWKVINIAFFLAPALAIWWERKCLKKHA